MRYFLGIDPDMHTLPIAVVDETGKLVNLQIVEVSKKLTGRDALVAMVRELSTACISFKEQLGRIVCATVEGQELYQFGPSKTKNPKSIMFLATVAGAALLKTIHMQSYTELYFPTPQEWKGNVPKQIHQARVLGRMGIKYTLVCTRDNGYCVPNEKAWANPTCLWSLKKSDWKHAVDAIGLAQWGREKFLDEEKRSARLAANPIPH